MTVGIDARLKLISGDLYDLDLIYTGDIASEDFFDTAIIVSLFAERRANESEVAESRQQRGWIGNESTPGFEMGSKLWLYEQSRLTRSVLNGIETAARDSLQWLVDDGFAIRITRVKATATITGINLEIVITRPNSQVERRYFDLWDKTAVPIASEQTSYVLNLNDVNDLGVNFFDRIGKPANPIDLVVNIYILMRHKRPSSSLHMAQF